MIGYCGAGAKFTLYSKTRGNIYSLGGRPHFHKALLLGEEVCREAQVKLGNNSIVIQNSLL